MSKQKKYYIMYNIGKCKYVVNYYNGVDKHNDGSDFYGIATFKNKKLLTQFINELINGGYIYRKEDFIYER